MTTPSKPKICIKCCHCTIQVHDYLCDRPRGEAINLVTGEPIKLLPRPCVYERSAGGDCGAIGIHFTPKT